MVRNLLIGASVLVVLLGVACLYLSHIGYPLSPALSPKQKKSIVNNQFKVEVTYCAPSVRNRLIFGNVEDGALQPYGEYWRLGANKATEISFNQDILFLDKEVEKGTYVMYAMPGPDYFDIGLNAEVGRWGYSEVDHSQDVVNVKIPLKTTEHTEQFTIELEKLYDNSVKIIFKWADKQWEIPMINNSKAL